MCATDIVSHPAPYFLIKVKGGEQPYILYRILDCILDCVGMYLGPCSNGLCCGLHCYIDLLVRLIGKTSMLIWPGGFVSKVKFVQMNYW